jgi:hypothetical protein
VDARMELWGELFSDSVGVMSALVIGFMIFMAIWFTWYFISHMMKYSEKMRPPPTQTRVKRTVNPTHLARWSEHGTTRRVFLICQLETTSASAVPFA